ncbi:hypothetical protein [Kaistia defluvii]|uniref:DNA-directed RNA polymerase subunit RPC12/RpoP n=1 Tax=Kaistia defluvii TaxID=410841 RepID=A0ABV2R4G9_9HYPH
MKEVKLELSGDDQPERMDLHAADLQEMFQSDQEGTTLICAACGKPMVEGFPTSFMVMAGVDLVCQHCEARNFLDTTAL